MTDASSSRDQDRDRERPRESDPSPERAEPGVAPADRSASLFGQSRAVFAELGRARGLARAKGGETTPAQGKAGSKTSTPADLPIVVASLKATRTLRGGLDAGDNLGLMDPTFTFQSVSHETKDGKLHLTATMHCDYHWGVKSHGLIDVPSGDAKFITAKNYQDIADDIDPDMGEAPNSAMYETYWSKKATVAHEKEHARDDWEDWGAQTTGVRIATKAWEAETVRSKHIDADLTALQTKGGDGGRHPGKINAAVMAGSDAHYLGGGTDYHDLAGEIKAHAVGATIERPLAKAVRAHGKKLVEQANQKKGGSGKGGSKSGASGKAGSKHTAVDGAAGDDAAGELAMVDGAKTGGGGKGLAGPGEISTGKSPPRVAQGARRARSPVDAIAGLFG